MEVTKLKDQDSNAQVQGDRDRSCDRSSDDSNTNVDANTQLQCNDQLRQGTDPDYGDNVAEEGHNELTEHGVEKSPIPGMRNTPDAICGESNMDPRTKEYVESTNILDVPSSSQPQQRCETIDNSDISMEGISSSQKTESGSILPDLQNTPGSLSQETSLQAIVIKDTFSVVDQGPPKKKFRAEMINVSQTVETQDNCGTEHTSGKSETGCQQIDTDNQQKQFHCNLDDPDTNNLSTKNNISSDMHCEQDSVITKPYNLNIPDQVNSSGETELNTGKNDDTEDNTEQDVMYFSQEGMMLTEKPEYVTDATAEFNNKTGDNYLRGCKWAPDGTCLLTNSNDNCLRLFNLPQPLYEGQAKDIPEMTSALKMQECDTIYDFCWYPKMVFDDPATQCLVSTCKDNPVHLFDANTGLIRCSYRPYNHLDEITTAYSLAFNSDGTKLYCGFNKMIRIFDLARPGRDCVTRPTYYSTAASRAKTGQPGIISCIVPSPQDPGMYAAGSYARGIAVYCEPKGEMAFMFEGQQGGVTHLAFSPDGTKLYSGGRKDPEIICWDLRFPGRILFVALREVLTNQRIYFELDETGRYLLSGSHNGAVHIWDTTHPPEELFPGQDHVLKITNSFHAHKDTVNGISLHPYLPILATASGQRHFPSLDNSDDDSDNDNGDIIENSVKLWSFPKQQESLSQ